MHVFDTSDKFILHLNTSFKERHMAADTNARPQSTVLLTGCCFRISMPWKQDIFFFFVKSGLQIYLKISDFCSRPVS